MLYDNMARIAAWTPVVLVILTIGSAIAWWLARRKRASFVQGLSKQIFGLSIVTLAVAYLPMAPLFRSAEKLSTKEGKQFPDVEFKLVSDGSSHRLQEYKGRVVVINFWATWCGPCREELPALNRLQQSYRDRGVVVLTLSDERPDEIAGFLQKTAPDTFNGSVESYGWLAIRDFRPWSVVIDRAGNLRDYVFGMQDFESFEKKILRLL
ncbi:MAG: TlpA family protein disulfide reductase [Acidobacteriia bacterium]|nr:TlpA family protein disulfide reductase [Terriglobia bacterium]